MASTSANIFLLFLLAATARGEPEVSPIEREACRLQLTHQEFPLACLRMIQARGETLHGEARRNLDRACLQARNIDKFSLRQINQALEHLPVTKHCRRVLKTVRRKKAYQDTEKIF